VHESGRTVLANGFAAKKNWFRANRERNRVKARSGNLSMVVLCLLAFLRVAVGKPCAVQPDGADGVLAFNLLPSAELYTP
jgi:hypothetical protein